MVGQEEPATDTQAKHRLQSFPSHYTAKNLFVFSENLKTHRQENGKWKCNDTFSVADIQYNDKRQIVYLRIYNQRTKGFVEFYNNV